MKKNIFKKIFIKFSKLLGFEIIDQSEFNSPTLNKELNEELYYHQIFFHYVLQDGQRAHCAWDRAK